MTSNKIEKFRQDYPIFRYESFHWEVSEAILTIIFRFSVGSFCFEPRYSVPLPGGFVPNRSALDNLVFHLGMCESISYWKTTCAPTFKIAPFGLPPEALEWWKRLFYNGLGEFRYLNHIDISLDDFVHFECETEQIPTLISAEEHTGILVPIGGGKDSAVTLELLKAVSLPKFTFTLNEIPAARRTRLQAGYDPEKQLNVQRTLSPIMLKMNEQGFLNGHTPFSALLAFLTTLVASLHHIRYVALSNESSANEPTIAGTNINHQYSKTVDFERDFRDYCSRYITPNVLYFSFLRPIDESEIARLFSRFKHHHATFRSCNRGSKHDAWCGKCSKCLFVWIILSPYLTTEALTQIFGRNLEADTELLEDFRKLTGIADEKPFECIGTIDEVRSAIVTAYNNGHQDALYQYFMETDIPKIIQKPALHTTHFLPESFYQILTNALYE